MSGQPMQTPAVRLRRAALLAACVVLALAGCALPSPPVRPAVYDFGPGAREIVAPAPAAPLALAPIQAPPALDGTAMLYRLAYVDAQHLQPYALARWSMPPAQLVHQRLREVLGREGAVLGPGDPGAGRELRIELEEFSQLFDSPQASVGLLRLRATLIDTQAMPPRLLAQRGLVVQRPAPQADAAGGVRALAAAADEAALELAQWLRPLR